MTKSQSTFPSFTHYLNDHPTSSLNNPPRICIVTTETLGLWKNGGMGTSFHHTAMELTRRGCAVTMLYARPAVSAEKQASAEAYYKKNQIGLKFLYQEMKHISVIPTTPADEHMKQSYLSCEWLKKNIHDIAIFADYGGIAYYSTLAKEQGIGLSGTGIVIQMHGCRAWVDTLNDQVAPGPEARRQIHMEKEAIRRADILTSPTQYLMNWIDTHGFILPEHAYVEPYALPWSPPNPDSSEPMKITELVFFGRLEERKGLPLFCDAIDILNQQANVLENLSITFLGSAQRIGEEPSLNYIARRSESWQIPYKNIDNYGSEDAIDYLKGEGRLPLICSNRGDNSPLTVLECLYSKIPFLACEIGGVPELIDKAFAHTHIFKPYAKELAKSIRNATNNGLPPAMPAADIETVNQNWVNTMSSLASTACTNHPVSSDLNRSESMALCITHNSTVKDLESTLASIIKAANNQTEIVVATTSENAPSIAQSFSSLGLNKSNHQCSLVKVDSKWNLAEARNAAIAASKGNRILFLESGTLISTGAINGISEICRHRSADSGFCLEYVFDDEACSIDAPEWINVNLALGNTVPLCVLDNPLTLSNLFVSRRLIDECGGFSTEATAGYENYELLTRSMNRGFSNILIPEPWFGIPDSKVEDTSTSNKPHPMIFRSMLNYVQDSELGHALLSVIAQRYHHHGRFAEEQNNSAETAMTKRLQDLADHNVKRVAIYGAGLHTQRAIGALRRSPVTIAGIIDDFAERIGGKFQSWPVVTFDNINQIKPDAIIISSDTIEETLYRKAIENTKKDCIPVYLLYGQPSEVKQAPAVRQKMNQMLQDIASAGLKRVCIYGSGEHTHKALAALINAPVAIIGIIDDNENLHGGMFCKWPVFGWSEALDLSPDAVIVSSDLMEIKMYRKGCKEAQDTDILVTGLYDTAQAPFRQIEKATKCSVVKQHE